MHRHQIRAEAFRFKPDLMVPVSESKNFRLDRRTVTRSVYLFGDVSVQVEVVDDDLGHVIVGESLEARNLEFFYSFQR